MYFPMPLVNGPLLIIIIIIVFLATLSSKGENNADRNQLFEWSWLFTDTFGQFERWTDQLKRVNVKKSATYKVKAKFISPFLLERTSCVMQQLNQNVNRRSSHSPFRWLVSYCSFVGNYKQPFMLQYSKRIGIHWETSIR